MFVRHVYSALYYRCRFTKCAIFGYARFCTISAMHGLLLLGGGGGRGRARSVPAFHEIRLLPCISDNKTTNGRSWREFPSPMESRQPPQCVAAKHSVWKNFSQRLGLSHFHVQIMAAASQTKTQPPPTETRRVKNSL